MKLVMILVVLFGMGVTMTGCNTVHGAGRDMERGGEKLQDTADRNR